MGQMQKNLLMGDTKKGYGQWMNRQRNGCHWMEGRGDFEMKYPFMTLDDETEIVHSEMKSDGSVEVYIEKPDEKDCFHNMTIILPQYRIENIVGFSEDEVEHYKDIVRSTAHLILEFSQVGGLDNASGF